MFKFYFNVSLSADSSIGHVLISVIRSIGNISILTAFEFHIFQCFFCKTEIEFNELCQLIRDKLIAPEKQPLFEICNERPKQWSPSLDESAVEALGACSFAGRFSNFVLHQY